MEKYQEAKAVCRMLTEAGFPTMLAGGCVRDQLLGRTPNDYDLATTALPEEVRNFFNSLNMKVIGVGEEHGTVSLITPLQGLEITTLRHDVVCDGRHAQVAFSKDFRDDALRRDFTINALFEDHEGKIHDFVGGQDDMKHKRLRFVGDPNARIREDFLRILRYFRFLGRLGWEPRKQQMAAIFSQREGLLQLSAERVHKELAQTWTTNHVGLAVRHLAASSTLSTLFPWFQSKNAPTLTQILPQLKHLPTLFAWHCFYRFGYGGPWPIKNLDAALAELRFSRKDKRVIMGLERLFQHQDMFAALTHMLRLGSDEALDLPLLKEYLALIGPSLKWKAPPLVLTLLDGLLSLDAPEIPRTELLRQPPKNRGGIVDLSKIFWYLGECRDTNELREIVSNPDFYRTQLQQKASRKGM